MLTILFRLLAAALSLAMQLAFKLGRLVGQLLAYLIAALWRAWSRRRGQPLPAKAPSSVSPAASVAPPGRGRAQRSPAHRRPRPARPARPAY